jgi:hypothetical protein
MTHTQAACESSGGARFGGVRSVTVPGVFTGQGPAVCQESLAFCKRMHCLAEGRLRSSRVRTLVALAAATSWALIGATAASASPSFGQAPAGHYNHIFVIVEENHSFTDVIGNPATPNLNALAQTYGIATKYFAVAHPSEPNYVAILCGSAKPHQRTRPRPCELEGLPAVAPPSRLPGHLLPRELQRHSGQGPALRLQARRDTELHHVPEQQGLVAPGSDRSAEQGPALWPCTRLQLGDP